jgi:hypothetical protein
MDGFSVLDFSTWEPGRLQEQPAYVAGNALGWLYRGNKQASTQHPLSGRLYLAKSGWLLLSVPNALVRGVYDALAVPGAELPRAGVLNVPNVDADLLNAHISVMTADEVQSIGADKISERGHAFHYSLGPLTEIDVKKINGVSKVWAIKVSSPELAALRKTYGLPPLLHEQHAFHITVAVRRKGVLLTNDVCKGGEPVEVGSFENPPSRGELKAAAVTGADNEYAVHNGQIPQKIAQDYLQKRPTEGPPQKEVTKHAAGYTPYNPYKSVYMQELLNQFNRRAPLIYNHNKPVFQNIQDQLLEIKRRGDFVLRTQRNYDIYKSQVDPVYRNQIGLQAMRGQLAQPAFSDRMLEQYGDGILASFGGGR